MPPYTHKLGHRNKLWSETVFELKTSHTQLLYQWKLVKKWGVLRGIHNLVNI